MSLFLLDVRLCSLLPSDDFRNLHPLMFPGTTRRFCFVRAPATSVASEPARPRFSGFSHTSHFQEQCISSRPCKVLAPALSHAFIATLAVIVCVSPSVFKNHYTNSTQKYLFECAHRNNENDRVYLTQTPCSQYMCGLHTALQILSIHLSTGTDRSLVSNCVCHLSGLNNCPTLLQEQISACADRNVESDRVCLIQPPCSQYVCGVHTALQILSIQLRASTDRSMISNCVFHHSGVNNCPTQRQNQVFACADRNIESDRVCLTRTPCSKYVRSTYGCANPKHPPVHWH